MGRVERAGDLGEDGHGLGRLHGPIGEAARQVDAVDVAHRQVGRAVELAGLVDRDDVGVVDRGREVGLAVEPRAEVGVVGQLVGQQLERHLAPQFALLGEVDDAHAAAAEDPLDAVRPEVGAEARVGTRRGHGATNRAVFDHQSYSAALSPSSRVAQAKIGGSAYDQ